MHSLTLGSNDQIKVTTSGPFVVVGTNGSGKSQLGQVITKRTDAAFISAVRVIAAPNSVAATFDQPTGYQGQHEIVTRLSNPVSSDFEKVIQILVSMDLFHARSFRDKAKNNASPGRPTESPLEVAERIWCLVLPGRSLSIANGVLKVGRGIASYGPGNLSDGERTILYLIGRVLVARPGFIVVDEPDAHLHAALARSLWDQLESARPDCTFVHLTHNIGFALSRRSETFILPNADTTLDVRIVQRNDMGEVAAELLGAASLVVSAKRIIFCEGELDRDVLSAWTGGRSTAVLPVGGSEKVRECVSTFTSGQLPVSGCLAEGLVDRDYWPDGVLAQGNGISVLPYHEIEGLFCTSTVYSRVAAHIGKPDAAKEYHECLSEARGSFTGALLERQILERVKRRLESEALRQIGSCNPGANAEATLSSLKATLTTASRVEEASQAYEEERQRVKGALAGTADDFLRVLPCKGTVDSLSRRLGMVKKGYIETSLHLIRSAIAAEASAPLDPKSEDGSFLRGLEGALPKRDTGR